MSTGYERKKAWRLANPEGRNAERKRNYDKTAYAPAHGQPWTQEEDRAVKARNVPDSELAGILQRSTNAIHKRRLRLKMREPE